MTLAGRLSRNPASGLSEIIRRAERRVATEAQVIDTWTREEAETLLRVAREHEPRFAPVLHFALATGWACAGATSISAGAGSRSAGPSRSGS